MKLSYADTSPFVRKVTIAALETGLDDRIERVATNYRDPKTDYVNINPLGKVPALTLDDGRILIESPVICEYLDSLHDGPKLVPPEGEARLQALTLQALADGALDAQIRRLQARGSTDGVPSEAFDARQKGKVVRTLDVLEGEAASFDGPITIGHISIACMLGWFDQRFLDMGWRDGRPNLASWYEPFAARPSMKATEPKET